MKFRFRPALTAAAFAALLVLCSLGAWQLRRLEWKYALIAKTELRLAAAPIPFEEALARAAAGEDLEYQPVMAIGAFRREAAARVFSAHEGKAGILLFAPFDAGGRTVYVNRGFVPQDAAPHAELDSPPAEIRVEGLFRRAEEKAGLERVFAPKDQPTDNLYFARDPRIFGAARGLDVPPYYIDSFGRENRGPWPKGGLTRVEFANRHLEYALTWFGLAAALIGVYVAFSLRRE
jgi:surfeit locus 1 family protein